MQTVTLHELQSQMAEIAARIALLEKQDVAGEITEEELLAVSAAIGAFLGVRPHIRQIRLIGTSAWAQQGRVSIQASHMLKE